MTSPAAPLRQPPHKKPDPDLELALRVAYAIQDHGYPTAAAPPFSDKRYQGNFTAYWQQVAVWAVQLLRDNPMLCDMSPEELQALIDRHRVEVAAAWGMFIDPAKQRAKDWGEEFDKAAAAVGKTKTSANKDKQAATAALLAGLSLKFGEGDQ